MKISVISAVIGIGIILAGRIKGLHMTEGEALIELWRYWVAGGGLCLVGIYGMNRNKRSNVDIKRWL